MDDGGGRSGARAGGNDAKGAARNEARPRRDPGAHSGAACPSAPVADAACAAICQWHPVPLASQVESPQRSASIYAERTSEGKDFPIVRELASSVPTAL